jgi:FKBP-type peptidyl-prolyl cis-trans isomerase FkpA
MLKQYIPLALMSFLVITNSACNAQNGSYKKTATGLEYKIVKDAPGTKKPALGDVMTFHLKLRIGDSVLFNSREMNKNEPVPYQVQAPAFKGDVSEGFMMLTAGDTASFRVSADSMQKVGMMLPEWVEKGKNVKIQFDVKVVNVQTQAEMQAEAQTKAAAQIGIDDKLLQDYFAKNNIKATKTASGLYYKIDKPGSGPTAAAGQSVTMEYTGKTMDGTKFDSNVDPQFQHVQPFTFVLGQGQVIRGWDEGIALMNKGAKGTLYIPSPMAYGAQSPSPAIPANSVLIFDVEVKDIAASAPQGK